MSHGFGVLAAHAPALGLHEPGAARRAPRCSRCCPRVRLNMSWAFVVLPGVEQLLGLGELRFGLRVVVVEPKSWPDGVVARSLKLRDGVAPGRRTARAAAAATSRRAAPVGIACRLASAILAFPRRPRPDPHRAVHVPQQPRPAAEHETDRLPEQLPHLPADRRPAASRRVAVAAAVSARRAASAAPGQRPAVRRRPARTPGRAPRRPRAEHARAPPGGESAPHAAHASSRGLYPSSWSQTSSNADTARRRGRRRRPAPAACQGRVEQRRVRVVVLGAVGEQFGDVVPGVQGRQVVPQCREPLLHPRLGEQVEPAVGLADEHDWQTVSRSNATSKFDFSRRPPFARARTLPNSRVNSVVMRLVSLQSCPRTTEGEALFRRPLRPPVSVCVSDCIGYSWI